MFHRGQRSRPRCNLFDGLRRDAWQDRGAGLESGDLGAILSTTGASSGESLLDFIVSHSGADKWIVAFANASAPSAPTSRPIGSAW